MPKTLTPESMLELSFVSDPQLSAGGRHAAAVHTVIERPEDENKPPEYKSHIVLYDLETGEARPFTEKGSSASKPRFSPDGSQLAFSRSRGEEKPQLHLISLSGGEARKLTEFKSGVLDFAWHPDSRRLAVVSRGDWEDNDAKAGKARVIDRMHYKADGLGFRPTEVAQIYLCEVGSGTSEQISKLESDPSGLVFSPDGETLYFSGAKDTTEDDRWHSNLWALPLTGGKARALVNNLSMASSPSPSPDGVQLAFFAPLENENFASPTGLWLVSSRGGEARLLTGDLDATQAIGGDSRYGDYPNRPCWSECGHKVVINANRSGRSGLAEVDIETGDMYTIQEDDRAVTAFGGAAGNFVFTAETPSRPGELYLHSGAGERQLSKANTDFLERYELAEAGEERIVCSEGGPGVSYWTLSPAKARKDHALVLQIHGGPHTNYGYGFYFEFQLLAARGYTVVYGNPRGSSSYGFDFATAMLGGYGTIDADDVLAVARDARAKHGDPEAPMHLTGGSYGGFMTNWLVGHTDEFRSAVTQRSICNWLSFYGASDIGYRFAELEVAGTPWGDSDRLWEQSPLKYVANVSTPLLIIHAEEDHRCPVEQAEQFYIALKRLGKAPTRFVRIPGEGHELSRSGRPDRRIARLEAIVGWFEEHA